MKRHEEVHFGLLAEEKKPVARRTTVMKALETRFGIEFVRESEAFGGVGDGGIWTSGEGSKWFDQYCYADGIHPRMSKYLEKVGWFAEWYDAGTVMLWKV